MKVALYFEKPDDLIQELRAVEEVSKRVGKFFIAFAAREECEFEMDGQKFFACAFDELSFDEFDYIIFPDDLSKINFPPEKILTPAQFTKKFLKDNPPRCYFLLTRTQSIMSSPRYILFLRLRRTPKLLSKLFFPTTNILQNTTQISFNSMRRLIQAKSATRPLRRKIFCQIPSDF